MKKKYFIIGLCVILGICACVLSFILFKSNAYNKMLEENRYPNTTKIIINDWDIYASSQTAEDVYRQYIESHEDEFFIVTLGGVEYTLNITDNVQHSIKQSDFSDLIIGISKFDYIFNSNFIFELNDSITIDDNATDKLIELLDSNTYNYTEAKNASFNEDTYEIIESVNGTQIDTKLAVDAMKTALNSGENSLNLDNEKYYIKPTVTTEDIKKEYGDLIDIINWEVSYNPDITNYVIKMKDYMNYVDKDESGNYIVDDSFLSDAVLALSKTVDKSSNERVFKSTLDGEIIVTGGTWGQCMNNAEEINFLKEKLNNRESVENRTPIWIRDPETIGTENTYIEVDLSAQHVWYYENGELVMDSDCVTGTANTSRATPTGSFYISQYTNGKYLIGPTWKTWVDKWMRLTPDGVGLHDASWRKAFGGDIYKTDGSHGCINLPKEFAYDLFDKVGLNTLVIIHE